MFTFTKGKSKTVSMYSDKPLKTIGMIGLVVGHTEKQQGAVNYLGETEYLFNKRIARKVQEQLHANSIGSVVIERPAGNTYANQAKEVARMCRKYGVVFSLHLHFNSSSAFVMGCEALVPPYPSEDNFNCADYITDKLNSDYGFVQRHDSGVKELAKGHSGYLMLNEVRASDTVPVLIEPTFANIRHRESILIFEQEDKYVSLLADCLYRIARSEVEGGIK